MIVKTKRLDAGAEFELPDGLGPLSVQPGKDNTVIVVWCEKSEGEREAHDKSVAELERMAGEGDWRVTASGGSN